MANPQHEPTMEEILASIRKIIAEDPAGGESASASPAESDEPEVLNLTQEVHEESTVTASAPTQAGEEQATTDANDTATHSSEGIFSDKARKALSDAFAGLEPESHQTGNEQVPSMSGLPLEALFEKAVREAFEPAIAARTRSVAANVATNGAETAARRLVEYSGALLWHPGEPY